MRSDFWSLPYAAQQAIRRGERDASRALGRARTIAELEAKVDELEKALTAANEKGAAYEVMASSDGVVSDAMIEAGLTERDKGDHGSDAELLSAVYRAMRATLTQSSVQPNE